MPLRRLLEACWWRGQHAWLATLLWPLATLYGGLVGARSLAYRAGLLRSGRAPVPVVVVGNLVAGGAGKTPATLALVSALKAAGWSPGIVSRGYGGSGRLARAVSTGHGPKDCGDEPLLLRRRSGVPVWVGADRLAAARALCAAHPEVDVLVADDGRQHLRLVRDAELIVIDERGVGNGHLLPAGPLRERPPRHPPPHAAVLYNAPHPTTAWPGHPAPRRLAAPVPLARWWRGEAGTPGWPAAVAAEPIVAAAGTADPERFFVMLEQAGLQISRMPLPDHASWDDVAWPPGQGPMLVTEKDAVKIPPTHPEAARVHVVPLDFELPAGVLEQILGHLPPRPRAPPASPQPDRA